MADNVLDISVDGTDARGLAAAEFPSKFHPQDVLRYAIQQDDANRLKAKKASADALRKLQELKVSGWRNHVDNISTQKQDILNASVDYFRKYPKSSNFGDYDPYDEKQSTAARGLQERINQYQADEQLSNQFKTWAQKLETDINSQGNAGKYTPESVEEFKRVASLPFDKFKEYYDNSGQQLPQLEQRFDYFTDGWKVAKSIGTHLNELELNGKRITNKAAVGDYITGSIESFLGGSASGQQYVKKMQESGMSLDDIVSDFKKKYVEPHLSTTYRNILSPVGQSFEKEKAMVGAPVTVDKVVTAPPVDKQGAAYIPLQYGGKHIYFDQYAPITAKNDQQLKSFAGSVGELYKVTKTNQGNFQTESVSAEEKSNFHPAAVMSNSRTGETALIMTTKNPKGVEPTNSQIKAQMTDEEKEKYEDTNIPEQERDRIYEEARQKALDKSVKGIEEVMYLAPMDASLESKYNTLVNQPLNQTFPARKNWTQNKPSVRVSYVDANGNKVKDIDKLTPEQLKQLIDSGAIKQQ